MDGAASVGDDGVMGKRAQPASKYLTPRIRIARGSGLVHAGGHLLAHRPVRARGRMDTAQAIVTIRDSKFGKSRQVPLVGARNCACHATC